MLVSRRLRLLVRAGMFEHEPFSARICQFVHYYAEYAATAFEVAMNMKEEHSWKRLF